MEVQRVILVNESDEPIGKMEKLEAHKKGLLHRAFSIFIFNSKGELLLQQRADSKYHSAGLWTNTCCSHPTPGDDIADAAKRRLKEEMGFIAPLEKLFTFTYRSSFENGLTEHELDHVFVGEYDGIVIPDPGEVKNVAFMSVSRIKTSLEMEPETFTVWFRIAFPAIEEWAIKRFGAAVEN